MRRLDQHVGQQTKQLLKISNWGTSAQNQLVQLIRRSSIIRRSPPNGQDPCDCKNYPQLEVCSKSTCKRRNFDAKPPERCKRQEPIRTCFIALGSKTMALYTQNSKEEKPGKRLRKPINKVAKPEQKKGLIPRKVVQIRITAETAGQIHIAVNREKESGPPKEHVQA